MATIRSFQVQTLQLYRYYSVPAQAIPEVRAELLAAVKSAMKNKQTLRSTTLRAVLADVYSADKTANKQVNSSAIVTILRKAAARRTEAAAQYAAAQRTDLAHKEMTEAKLLSDFLPPLLSEADVDDHLQKILRGLPKDAGASALKPGNIFKLFYNSVDKSTVDSEMVKRRLDVLLSSFVLPK